MTDIVVPFTGVTFLTSGGVPQAPSTGLTLVGSYPYVDTADGDTSYAQTEQNSIAGAHRLAVFYETPFLPAGTVTAARLDMQVWTPDGFINGSFYDTAAADLYWSPWPASGYPAGVWTTQSFDITSQLALLLSMLASGQQIKFQLKPASEPSSAACRVSYMALVLTVTGTPPLRQVQRNDGLGRSVMRARGTRSVQKSIRQRGYR